MIGRRWVLLESLNGNAKEMNAIATIPNGWQMESCPAVFDEAHFKSRKNSQHHCFMLNSLAPYDWQCVTLHTSKRGGGVKMDSKSGWPEFKMPRDPYKKGKPMAKYGLRASIVALCR